MDLPCSLTPWEDTGVVFMQLFYEIPLIPYTTFFSSPCRLSLHAVCW